MIKQKIKLTSFLVYILVITVLYALLKYPSEASEAVVSALKLCISAVIPSLFPFLVISALIVSTGLATKIGGFLKAPMNILFKLPGEAGVSFLLGILSGYPVGATSALSLYKNGICSKSESERLLAFCNNTGPAFVIGSVGLGMFTNIKIGIALYLIHIISAVITGLLISLPAKRENQQNKSHGIPIKVPFGNALVDAVRKSSENMLYIVGFIAFFSVITRLFDLLLGVASPLTQSIIGGIFEVASGINCTLENLGTTPYSLIISSAILGWAGLSVHAQVSAIISESDLSAKLYIFSKAIQALISALLTFLLLIL